MSAHTPGPWRISRRNPRAVIGLIEGCEELVAMIGDMPCINGHDDEAAERGFVMEASNARLIAAAPTMYDFISARAAHGDAEAQAIVAGVSNASR